MSDRQPKFLYGPLLGFLTGLMFFKASGKYYNFDSSTPWYVSEKPAHYNDKEYFSQWHPLQDPYNIATTPIPSIYGFHSASASGFGEEIAAASNVNVYRRKPNRYKTNAKRRRNGNRPNKRRRTTTTTTTEAYYYEDDYYYSDESENYSEEVRRTVRPSNKRKRTTTPVYEEYEDYSIEATTKPKRRKKPTFSSASIEAESTTKKLLTQRQATTTTEETTTISTTNTTMTTVTTTFAGYNGTNLHDNITFTYGPPTSNDSNFGPVYTNYGPPAIAKLDNPPFWYTSFKSKNDIIKRVQDIVDEGNYFDISN